MKVSSLLKAVLLAGSCLLGVAAHAQSRCTIGGDPKHLGGNCSDTMVRGPEFVGNSPVQSPGCPAGQVASGGVCVRLTTAVGELCSAGSVMSGSQCVVIPNQSLSNLGQLQCPPGYVWSYTTTRGVNYQCGSGTCSTLVQGAAMCVDPGVPGGGVDTSTN
jgi:hypothetical protein